jgi:hypothetical protein
MSRTSTTENRINEQLGTPSDLKADAIRDISAAPGGLLAARGSPAKCAAGAT